MYLKINDREYDVDIEPLRGKLLTGLTDLVQGADANATHSMLRQIVKQACNVALSPLGLTKKDRNDDPIQLVAGRIADIIFTQVQAGGLSLEGRELLPLKQSKEAAADDGNTSDGRGSLGDHGGNGER